MSEIQATFQFKGDRWSLTFDKDRKVWGIEDVEGQICFESRYEFSPELAVDIINAQDRRFESGAKCGADMKAYEIRMALGAADREVQP